MPRVSGRLLLLAFHSMVHHDEVISIVLQFSERVRMFDTQKIDYIIEEGERATLEQVPYLRRLLGVPSPATAAA